MSASEFTLVTLPSAIKGARHIALSITWTLSDGSKLDLTGATITGEIQNRAGTERAIDGALTPDGDQVNNKGLFTWAYGATDVGTAGDFLVQFKATFTNYALSLPALWSVEEEVSLAAFPFSFDPALSTDRDYLRSVIGDKKFKAGPQPDGGNFSDKEIDTFLTKAGSDVNGAFILMCTSLAAQWSSFAVIERSKVGSLNARKASEEWATRAATARKFPITDAGQKPFVIGVA